MASAGTVCLHPQYGAGTTFSRRGTEYQCFAVPLCTKPGLLLCIARRRRIRICEGEARRECSADGTPLVQRQPLCLDKAACRSSTGIDGQSSSAQPFEAVQLRVACNENSELKAFESYSQLYF